MRIGYNQSGFRTSLTGTQRLLHRRFLCPNSPEVLGGRTGDILPLGAPQKTAVAAPNQCMGLKSSSPRALSLDFSKSRKRQPGRGLPSLEGMDTEAQGEVSGPRPPCPMDVKLGKKKATLLTATSVFFATHLRVSKPWQKRCLECEMGFVCIERGVQSE